MTVLITGAAGFIGFHLSKRLLEEGTPVIGIDNINSYYDTSLKRERIRILNHTAKVLHVPFELFEESLENKESIEEIFKSRDFTRVVNLAAQAGVRFSIENPSEYIQSNLVGFSNILEGCRHKNIEHLIFASSSSVYGGNKKVPFKEEQTVDHPVSLYAATKKANELMAHSYSHLYGLPVTGLRFFTVYGPWGRPDMALFLFTKAILAGEPIKVFNNGNMIRDFTYIDDIIESIFRLLNKKPCGDNAFNPQDPNPGSSWAPYRIFNVGNSSPVELNEYIQAVEDALNIKATKELLPLQPGDVPVAASDTTSLEEWIGFKPNTSIKEGVAKFVKWYQSFYRS